MNKPVLPVFGEFATRLRGSFAAPSRGIPGLFAGCLGLGAVLVLRRWRTLLNLTDLGGSALFFAVYHDVLFAALLAWILRLVLARTGARASSALIGGAWIVLVVSAIYACIGAYSLEITHYPLTYRLMVFSDRGEGVYRDIVFLSTPSRILALIGAPVAVALCGFAGATWFGRFATLLARCFYSLPGVLFLGAYLCAGQIWLNQSGIRPNLIYNAHLVLMASLFDRSEPSIGSDFPPSFVSDFEPSVSTARDAWTGAASGMNIVLVMLESAGTSNLSLYGAPRPTTPNLQRLAAHAMTFGRIYAPQSFTSSALASVFCSVFPRHHRDLMGSYAAGMNIPGIADVLKAAKYRTGFLFEGRLQYDREDVLLRVHGFDVETRDVDAAPDDTELIRQSAAWIQRDPRNPFFLAMLTRETHHPYFVAATRDFGVGGSFENRYLNGLAHADAMIAGLAQELDRMGLAERTLLVVTGDHGEAFAEHGQLVHGFSVYEEEVHVPLLIINPRLFSASRQYADVGQQVDIAPTLLNLLGIEAPKLWQGRNLFAAPRSGRAYLFANSGAFSWGLIDGSMAFIFDENSGGSHVYNLSADPGQTHDLAGDRTFAAKLVEARQRLAAWSHFQNHFLDSHRFR